MSRIVYYLILYPLSLLPLPILYFISSGLFYVFYFLLGYRKKVIQENIDLVFKEMSFAERKDMARTFYRHLCDLIVEGIKGFNLSNGEIEKRYVIKGFECTIKDAGKDIILVTGHSGNWEWAAFAFPLVMKHRCGVIYTPLSDAFLNQKMASSRSRNGYDLIRKDEVKQYFAANLDQSRAVFFLSDQSPSNPKNAYWTSFLGIDTAVQYGIEKYAMEWNAPIYYIDVKKIKRGYYELKVEPLMDDASTSGYGEVVEKVTRRIEKSIYEQPEFWLWSHRRWKHKRVQSGE
jgi:KDO2-lipid IV(A) lauroyltransferase